MVLVDTHLEIPDDELSFVTSRSSGPGGQNVNKVDTRVTVLFDVDNSPSLSARQRQLLHERLPGRINKQGILRVVSQRHRTQSANRDAVVQRFAELIRQALTVEKKRVPSTVSAAAKERRLEQKHRRQRLKRTRSKDLADEE